jgi:hypothetical protein
MAAKNVGALWITGKNGDFFTGNIEISKLNAEIAALGVDAERVPIKIMSNTFKAAGSKEPDFKLYVNDWKPKPKT